MKMLKYMLCNEIKSCKGNIYISSLDEKSKEIIQSLKSYNLKGVYYEWQDEKGLNILLKHSLNENKIVHNNHELQIEFKENVQDIIYTILASYYIAKRKELYGTINRNYSSI